MPRILVVALALLACAVSACAGSSWKAAVAEDTAAAYNRFLREHPRAPQADEARERLAMARVRARPTMEGYRAFRAQYPDSALLPELRAAVAEKALAGVRAQGTVAAYRSFLEEFGDTRWAARARGNAEYLEAQGFGGSPAQLAAFAQQYPESDFAAEAERSVRSLETRRQTAFRVVGLVIEIDPGTPDAERLARAFAEQALRSYQAAGVELVPLLGSADPRAAELPALLHIQHGEKRVSSQLGEGQVASPGLQARTRVTLARAGEAQAIWSEEFVHHIRAAGDTHEQSILFQAGNQGYWSQFFVPVSTWDTQVARREPRGFEKPAVAVEALGSRAFVLLEDGEIQVLDLGDPARPVALGGYKRERDLTKWSGLRVDGARVVSFGPDGLEVVEFGASGARRVTALDRGKVGSIGELEIVDGALVIASSKGLLVLPDGSDAPEVLLQNEILGLARRGDRLLFTNGTSLYVSTLPLLRQKRTIAELRIGRGFRPGRLRLSGGAGVVLGEHGLLRLDVSNPDAPRILSRIEMAEVGAVADAALVGGRLFLLGTRGLQIADPAGERIAHAVDVVARQRIGASGRSVVVIGEKALQVVDATPFLVGPAAAAPAAR